MKSLLLSAAVLSFSAALVAQTPAPLVSPALSRAINVSATIVEGEAAVVGRSQASAKWTSIYVNVPAKVHMPNEQHTYAGHLVRGKFPILEGNLDFDLIEERIEFKAIPPLPSAPPDPKKTTIQDLSVLVPIEVRISNRDVVGLHRFSIGGVKYQVRADFKSDTATVEREK